MSTIDTFDKKNKSNIVAEAVTASHPIQQPLKTPARQSNDAVNSDIELQNPIHGIDAAIKRLIDIVVGSIALIILAPFFVLLAILIKLDSTGPALFHQTRQGRNREPIRIYKFRSMYQNYSTPVPTATSFKQTQKDDMRITRLGAFIRKTSLDELPQLYNVVQGSMSLIGPRPHPFPLDEQYRQYIPAIHSRCAVKPGLTGWAQVNGLRGETKLLEDMIIRIEYDLHYIKNWSLGMDLKILAMSTYKAWAGRNAY